MSHAGWKDVVDLAFALIQREPAPVQIFAFLAIAFSVLMFAEGLRANFFPWRPVVPRKTKRAPQSALAAAPFMEVPRPQAGIEAEPRETPPTPASRFSPRRRTPIARNLKRQVDSLRRQSPTKPRIRRDPRQGDALADAVHVYAPHESDPAAPAAAVNGTAAPAVPAGAPAEL